MTRPGRFDLNWILALLLILFAVAPLTYPGFFQAHSGFLPVFNTTHPADAPNWGRAADPLRGEGKLPYLLAWPFFKLSGSGVAAVKWGYGLAFLLGALGTYLWTRRWLGARGAVLAATVYTYLPWHLSTVYVRGAYAEAWLWAFLPFLPWAADRLAEGCLPAALAVGLPALAAAASTQPGLSALFLPILTAYGVTISFRRQVLAGRLVLTLALLLVLLFGLSWAAPPAPLPFADHFLYPYQLLSATWGFGLSSPGWQDGLSFQLGVAAVGLTIAALALKKREGAETGGHTAPPLSRAFWFWAVTLLTLALLTLTPAAWLWRISHLQAFLTWPWQLLTLAGMPLAFLAGSVARWDRRLAEVPGWAGVLCLVMLASYPYLAPRFTQIDPGPEPVAMFQPRSSAVPQIMILDHQIEPPAEITPTLTLTLTWQAVAPVADDYTIFVHLLTGSETKVAQLDRRPCGGECPTNRWLPGEIVTERYELSLPPQAPAGPYRLAVGLYLLDSGERAAVVGRDDQTVFFDVP